MLFPRFPLSLAFIAVGLLSVGSPVHAQMPREMAVRATLQGTITAFGSGKIQVVTPANQRWLVHVAKDTSVMVTGRADATVLAPGMYVKFRARVAGRQEVVQPVDKIQVFTPTQQDVPGAFPITEPVFDAGDPDKDVGKKTDDAKTDASYDVIGRITSIRGGKMIVSYGQGAVEVEPADNLQVDLAVADVRFARQGDQIFCVGTLLGPEAARTLRASSIQIRKPQAPDDGNADSREPSSGQSEANDRSATDRLVNLLTPRRGKTPDEQFQIEGDPTEFRPCAKRSVVALRRQFGPPVKTKVQGIHTVRGGRHEAEWQMLTWGPVKVIVDRSQKTRFFAVAP
ncbi:MAG: hypothetical protein JW719_03545 [Pirellulales bacterium]|nr:hypothetical protein [Pirellulales bacterium]